MAEFGAPINKKIKIIFVVRFKIIQGEQSWSVVITVWRNLLSEAIKGEKYTK